MKFGYKISVIDDEKLLRKITAILKKTADLYYTREIIFVLYKGDNICKFLSTNIIEYVSELCTPVKFAYTK